MPPNVLLLVVDALRADHVAPYNADADTPAIRSLAASGTTFDRAISTAPWTLPSVTSILTGKYPHEHGATSLNFELQRGQPLQADLSPEGYRCVHVSPTTWIGEWLPQGRGFDAVEEFTGPTHRHFDGGADVRRLSEGVARGPEWYTTVAKRALREEHPLRSLGNALAFKLTEARGDHWLDARASDRAAAAVGSQLDELAERDDPFFVYVHLMDPHLPFHVPDSFQSDVRPPGCETDSEEREYVQSLMDDVWSIRLGERTLERGEREFLRARYRDEVAYADSVVGEILDHLDRQGLRDETVVALTGDHGEHLGETVGGRTLLGHQTSVRLPLLRVPLIVRYPGTFDGGRRQDLVQTNYIAETVCGLAGLAYDRSRSLLPEDADARRTAALAEYAGVVRSHPPEGVSDDSLTVPRRSVVVGEWKLDAVGDRRRAARIDWDGNAEREVPIETVPSSVHRRLVEALPPPADERERGDREASTDQSIPGDVATRLEGLGYR